MSLFCVEISSYGPAASSGANALFVDAHISYLASEARLVRKRPKSAKRPKALGALGEHQASLTCECVRSLRSRRRKRSQHFCVEIPSRGPAPSTGANALFVDAHISYLASEARLVRMLCSPPSGPSNNACHYYTHGHGKSRGQSCV